MAALIDSIENQDSAWSHLQDLRRSDRLPHGQLICGGPTAVGFARALAQALVCEVSEAPCGTCGPCRRVETGQSEAVLSVEPDKGVIKLEAAGRISQFLSLSRLTRARVIVVSEAHALNVQATNAILKLVEEPPEASFFLFVTPDPGLLLPTLRSRLQVVRLRPPPRKAAERGESLREPVSRYLQGCLLRKHGAVRELLEGLGGREDAELAAHALQEWLRDWTFGDSGAPLNQEAREVMRAWPDWDVRARVALWRLARRMETDLHQHVDRGLVFENFYHQVPHAVD